MWGRVAAVTADRRTDFALLLLRFSGVGLALAHGLGKLVALGSGSDGFVQGVARLGFPFPLAFAWAAALVEVVSGLLIAVGLATRIAAVFGAVVVAVAAFLRHQALAQLGGALGVASVTPGEVEAWGSPEKALLYLLVFVALALLGPGRWSVGHLVARRRERRRGRRGYS